MASLGFKTFRGGHVDEHVDFQRLQLRSLGFTNCSQVHKIAVSWGSSFQFENVKILRRMDTDNIVDLLTLKFNVLCLSLFQPLFARIGVGTEIQDYFYQDIDSIWSQSGEPFGPNRSATARSCARAIAAALGKPHCHVWRASPRRTSRSSR